MYFVSLLCSSLFPTLHGDGFLSLTFSFIVRFLVFLDTMFCHLEPKRYLKGHFFLLQLSIVKKIPIATVLMCKRFYAQHPHTSCTPCLHLVHLVCSINLIHEVHLIYLIYLSSLSTSSNLSSSSGSYCSCISSSSSPSSSPFSSSSSFSYLVNLHHLLHLD